MTDEVVGFLADGFSVHLVGLSGSGRTRTLQAVADQLQADRRSVVRLAGVGALRDRPLAAIAVAGLDVPAGPNGASLGAAVATLVQLVEPPGSVVVVDDCDDMDDVSLGAVAAARARVPFAVVTTSRPGHRQSAARALSGQLGPAVRVAIDPLPLDQVHCLVHELLPGVVEATTVARIATLSGGLPGLVRALVSTARRTGALTRRRGVWRAEGPVGGPLLAPVVEALVQDLDPATLDALARIAAVGPVAPAALVEAVPAVALEELHQRGLLASTGAGPHEVLAVFPPLLEEHLTDVPAHADRREADLRPGPHAARLVAPRPGATAPQRHAAPVLSRQVGQHWHRTAGVLRVSWRSDPCARTALPLVRAMDAGGAAPRLVEQVLAATSTDADHPDDRAALAAWAALYRSLTRRSLDPAAEAALEEAPGHHDLAQAVRVHAQVLLDRVPEDAAPGVPPDPGAHLGTEALAVAWLGPLIAAGAVVDATARTTGTSRPRTARVLGEHHDVYRALATTLRGDVVTGTTLALRHLDRALTELHPGVIQAHAYTGALGLLLQGRLDDLEQLLATVLTIPGATPSSAHYRAGLLGTGAQTARWRGRDDYAAQLWDQAQDIGAGPGPFPGMITFAPAPGACPAELGAQLWTLAADRAARGYHAHALFLAATAVEQAPDPARARRVIRASRNVQGRLLPALARYVDAATRRDAAGLHTAVDALGAAGSALHATGAAVTRAVVLHEAGRTAEASDQADAAWLRARDFGSARRALFAPLRAAVQLSAREQEITALLTDGLSTTRVAAVLGLSDRTVEGHVLRACHRLGVGTRERLLAMARTWLL
jgi:DNA-binding CsgD family transcriptional regulator